MKNIYSEFWGGCIQLIEVHLLKELPEKIRYCYSDDEYDIYEAEDGTIYGLIAK